MTRRLLFIVLAAALPVVAQDMRPNQEPVPSPSDLATERPRIDGDRPTSAMQDPRSASAGATRPIAENPRGEPLPPSGR